MIDAHAHLDDARFAADLDAVLARARAAGLGRILTCGEDLVSSEAALAIAHRDDLVRVAVGVHPHRSSIWDDAIERRLRELARDARVVAIGEIGLDFSGRSAPRATQERALRAQLALAAELDLPVVVHVRDAGADVRALLADQPKVRGMLHCYSEGPGEVPAWLALGLSPSFAGTVTFAGADALRDAVRVVPIDRLLVETDAPYLAPEPHRGRRNEPAFVAATCARIAALRGMATDELAARVRSNAAALFGSRWA